MTLPDEEQRTLQYTRQFLLRLLDPKSTPRVPRCVRDEARARLRHYPPDYRVDMLYRNDG